MKDKKKKKQKSEEKLKKKKAALLMDEKIEKEEKAKKKKKTKQLLEGLESETMSGGEDTASAKEPLGVSEKAEKSSAKATGQKQEKAAKKKQTGGVSEEEAALIFRALGDETRLRIVGMLEEHELCAADLLKSVSIVQSTLSHHMKILCESGAVSCRREGRWSYYSINVEVMEKAADYLKKYRKA